MRVFKLLLIILVAALFFSCDSNRVFEDTRTFDNAYWLADSIQRFEFEITDNQEFNVLFSLRNGRAYPHSNIYVNYQIRDTTNALLDEELRNFQLFHQKSGFPFGKGSGNIYEHSFVVLTEYEFPSPGRYSIEFQQYMRYDSLPEVYSVGVRIETKED